MSKEYFELLIKPEDNYELFLNLILSLTDDAIEENDGEIIVRSEENLEDFQEPLEKFAKALNTKCYIKCEKKESIDWIKNIKTLYKLLKLEAFMCDHHGVKQKREKLIF